MMVSWNQIHSNDYTRRTGLKRHMSMESGGGYEQPMEAGGGRDWAEAVVNGPLSIFVGDGDERGE
jgi:hypothetical protein